MADKYSLHPYREHAMIWAVRYHRLRRFHHLSRYLLALLLAALSPAACGGLRGPIATPPPTLLRIAGSTEMMPLLDELGAAYTTDHPNISLDLQASGSRLGQGWLEEGRVDLAATSWYHPPGPQTPSPLVGTPIAWDGLAMIVHKDNPLSDVTLNQLQSIYEGRTLNWKELGGPDQDIVLVSREDGSGARDALEAQVMRDHRLSLAAIVMPSAQAMIEYVGSHPSSVGYISMGLITGTVKLLAIEGERPTPVTVRSRQYALSRVLYLLTQGAPSGASGDFVSFAVSPAGQEIVGKHFGRVR